MIPEEHVTYKLVNAEELQRILDLVDQRLADDLDIYRRLENLIKQNENQPGLPATASRTQ